MSVLELIPYIIGIVVFLGAAATFLRGSRDQGTISTLTKNNDALTDRVALLERENVAFSARVSALERENSALIAQRPSAEAIADLRDLVENQGALLARHDAQTMKLLRPRGAAS